MLFRKASQCVAVSGALPKLGIGHQIVLFRSNPTTELLLAYDNTRS
jgi:hypothetical protein